MADRIEKVTLLLEAKQYLAEYSSVAKKTRENTDDMKGRLEQQKQAYDRLGVSALAIGAAAEAAVAVAVSKFAEFDQAMSQVKAATQETTSNMGLLREAALDAGAKTSFSATDAAHAIEELGKNGLSTAQILSGGLDAALSLAAAGGIEVSRAAEIASITMKQFQLQGQDLPHVADLLAAGAGKAAGGVDELAQALNQSALVAHQTGLSVEDTTGTLAAFADAGLLGSDAGTSFKTMLQALNPKSAQAADMMKQLGINAYDAQGNFIGIEKYAGVLQDRLSKLTPEQRNAALATIFGSDAVRAASVLYEQGAEGIAKYIAQTNDSGYAAQVAADRLNNLAGDFEKLNGAIETGMIRSGGAANDVLRGLTQTATAAVDAFNSLPKPLQEVGLGATAVFGALLLLGGGFLTGVPKIAAFKEGLDVLRITATTTTAALRGTAEFARSPWGLAILAATSVIGEFVAGQLKAQESSRSFSDSLDSVKGTVTSYTRQLAATNLANSQMIWFWKQDSTFETAKKLGLSLNLVTDAALGSADALAQLEQAQTIAFFKTAEGQALLKQSGMDAIAYMDAVGKVVTAVKQQSSEIDQGRQLLEQKNAADQAAAASQQTSAEAYVKANEKVSKLNQSLTDLLNTLNQSNQTGQDAITTNISYQDTLAKVDDQIRKARDGQAGYKATLDQGTQAGRDNLGMLVDLASQGWKAAESQLALDNNTQGFKDRIDASRAAVMQRAMDFGATADEASRLADQIIRTPTEKDIRAILDTASAKEALDGFVRTSDGRQITLRANLAITGQDVMRGGYLQYVSRAGGGSLDMAPGPKGVDSMMFMGAKGEHVLTAREVDIMGGQSAVYKFRANLTSPHPSYALGGALGESLAPNPGMLAIAAADRARDHAGMLRQMNAGSEAASVAAAISGAIRSATPAPVQAGDTWAPVFQLTPPPGQSLAEQTFEAARRLKTRVPGRRR